ncbi:hypothetical protein VTO73DRAFT_10636 [Trametes versicolor]
MSSNPNIPASGPQDAEFDAILRQLSTLGPIMEPYYIIPESTLRRILRGRTAWTAPQPAPQQPVYNNQTFASSQHIDHPYPAPPGFSTSMGPIQPSSEHLAPLHASPTPNPGPMFYGYGPMEPQSRDQMYDTQAWGASSSSSDAPPQPTIQAEPRQMPPPTSAAAPPHPHSAMSVFQPGGFAFTLEADERPHASATFISHASKARACAKCHNSRRKCGWERPCKRCVHSGSECVEREAAPRKVRSAAPVGIPAAGGLVPQASTPGPSSKGAFVWTVDNVSAGAGRSHSGAASSGAFQSMGARPF